MHLNVNGADSKNIPVVSHRILLQDQCIAFVVSSLVLLTLKSRLDINEELIRKNLFLAWLFSFSGLLTGMIWAQFAWGAYWSCDPKEIATLGLFTLVCFSTLIYNQNKKISQILLLMAFIVIVMNIIITVSSLGLHSY